MPRASAAGCSGGGTCTLFTAALDTRVRAALVSSSLNTSGQHYERVALASIITCGHLNWRRCMMWRPGGARALFAEGGLDDDISPSPRRAQASTA